MEKIPFAVLELTVPDQRVHDLFQRSFNTPPPDFPRHFVALYKRGRMERVAGYVHYSEPDAGVFLCGGLCIDARVYRLLSPGERKSIAEVGSLSRWLSVESIAALANKRAVFAFTGDRRSRTDALAIGFIPISGRFLMVQWHEAPESERAGLVARVTALGAF